MNLEDLTEEEIQLILNSEEGARGRFDEQRQLGRSMRQQGTMGGGVRAPGVFVAESPFAMIGDLASRYKGMKDEKAGTVGLEGVEGRENEARSRAATMIQRMRQGSSGGAPPGSTQMSPVPQQGGPAPLTQFGNPNQPPQGGPPPGGPPTGGAQTFPMPEQAPMGPMTPMAPPPQQKPPMAPGIAPQASPVGPPTQGGPPGGGAGAAAMAGLNPQQMQMIQQWLSTLRK